MKALLVDDNEIYCRRLFEALAKRLKGCAIAIAVNAKDAERIMCFSRIDFVITDLNSPEADGYEFLSRVTVNHPDVRILIITGRKTPEVAERLHSLGVSRCIEKPFDAPAMAPMILDELGAS